jgi:hypothetical protein
LVSTRQRTLGHRWVARSACHELAQAAAELCQDRLTSTAMPRPGGRTGFLFGHPGEFLQRQVLAGRAPWRWAPLIARTRLPSVGELDTWALALGSGRTAFGLSPTAAIRHPAAVHETGRPGRQQAHATVDVRGWAAIGCDPDESLRDPGTDRVPPVSRAT